MFEAVAFVVNNQAYTGLGGSNNFDKRIWKYDPSTDKWSENGIFKGSGRQAPVIFALPDRVLIGTGEIQNSYLRDFVQYKP